MKVQPKNKKAAYFLHHIGKGQSNATAIEAPSISLSNDGSVLHTKALLASQE